MSRVFLSHASTDYQIVLNEIGNLLKAHQIDIWISETGIASATRWERMILGGLESCDWFLVALTKHAEASEWVKDEVQWAIEHRSTRLVPVLLGNCDPRAVHIRLARIQYVDFRERDDAARARLLATWGMDYSKHFDKQRKGLAEVLLDRLKLLCDVGGVAEEYLNPVLALVRSGVDLSVCNSDGDMPLHWVFWNRQTELAREMIERGAPVNARDAKGRTPLYAPAHHGQIEMIGEMLAHGADPMIADHEGLTPIDHATRNGKSEAAALMRDFVHSRHT